MLSRQIDANLDMPSKISLKGNAKSWITYNDLSFYANMSS